MLASVIARKAKRLLFGKRRGCLPLRKEARSDTETEARLLIPVNFARAAGITARTEGAMPGVDRRILGNTKVLSGFARRHQDARPGGALANINENASEVATDRASVKARTASNFKYLSVFTRRHKAPGKGKYQGRKQGITTRNKEPWEPTGGCRSQEGRSLQTVATMIARGAARVAQHCKSLQIVADSAESQDMKPRMQSGLTPSRGGRGSGTRR
jgi:hypothetical protein